MNGTTFAFSESTQAFIDEQVASGRFASANEFVENVLEQARKHAARERVDQLLLQGLDSGPGIEVTPEWWRNKADEWAKELGEGQERVA
jgi:antitoxin ParD1/3/4